MLGFALMPSSSPDVRTLSDLISTRQGVELSTGKSSAIEGTVFLADNSCKIRESLYCSRSTYKDTRMTTSYTIFADLVAEVEPPADGTLSRTIFQDERLKAVLFGFAAGQELSEHTASMPAIMHFLRGDASVTLGSDTHQATAGTWIHMPAQLPHSIHAKTPTVMLLLLLKQPPN